MKSSTPWLPLSVVEIFILGLIAAFLVEGLAWSVLQLRAMGQKFGCVLGVIVTFFRGRRNEKRMPSAEKDPRAEEDESPRVDSSQKKGGYRIGRIGKGLVIGLVVASTLIHPALPALLGVCILACTTFFLPLCCATSDTASATSSSTISLAVDWLCVHILAAVPAVVWIFGWIVSGRSHPYPALSAERGCMVIIGTHACAISFHQIGATSKSKDRTKDKRDKTRVPRSRPHVLVCSVLAMIVAFGGLWGRLIGVMVGATMLCSWELIRMSMQGIGGEEERNQQREDTEIKKAL